MATQLPLPADVMVISEDGQSEPIRAFVEQLLGAGVRVLEVAVADLGPTMPAAQVAFLDVATDASRVMAAVPSPIASPLEAAPPVIQLASRHLATHLLDDPALADFLLVPARLPDIMARMRWVVQRHRSATPLAGSIEVGGLRIDTSTYEVSVDGRPVVLTHREFELLKFLVTHQNHVFSRSELLQAVWDSSVYDQTRTVDVHIRRLRAKLGLSFGTMIHTVRGVGYRFG